jgi:hypothetical protein
MFATGDVAALLKAWSLSDDAGVSTITAITKAMTASRSRAPMTFPFLNGCLVSMEPKNVAGTIVFVTDAPH